MDIDVVSPQFRTFKKLVKTNINEISANELDRLALALNYLSIDLQGVSLRRKEKGLRK